MFLFIIRHKDGRKTSGFTLLPDSVATCDDLAEIFLKKYVPSTKNVQLRVDITSFKQAKGESLYVTSERFKELLRKYPYHGIPH